MEISEESVIFDREISLIASVDELDQMLEWIGEILEAHNCPGKISSQIAVAAEEFFVNIARYAYGEKTGKALIRTGRKGSYFVMQFEDSGVAFNPLEHKMPDINAGIKDRTIGGLGIYLARKWMDEIVYKRDNGKNILTLYKTITTGA
ncbi:MAG: ATP-binding protein [Treponema sp.]|jgi:anti-sigma regulatory factor (Ser/Thr protein kinase)|nr:ATP-binding protein [Treponema sp.]